MVSIGSFTEPSDDASSREGRSVRAKSPNRIAFMADGGIVEYGPPKKVLDIPRVERTRGFLRRSAGACRAGLRAGADGASHDAEGPVGFHRAHAFADRLGDELFTTHRWSSRPSPLLAAGGQRRIAAAKIVGQMGNDVGRAGLPGKAELSGVSGSR